MIVNDDLSQLRMLEATFEAAMRGKDVNAVMTVYAPGTSLFVFDVVGPPAVHTGWDEYREAFKQMFASIKGALHFSIADLEIEVSGNIGYSRSMQQVSGVHANDGKAFDYTVRVTNVYRKLDGKWFIVQEHISLALDRSTFTPMLHLASFR
jgi:ketosteroid isomerase-like protein